MDRTGFQHVFICRISGKIKQYIVENMNLVYILNENIPISDE